MGYLGRQVRIRSRFFFGVGGGYLCGPLHRNGSALLYTLSVQSSEICIQEVKLLSEDLKIKIQG
jgi:hypothetical protein